jgi:hypothetical protein
MLKYALHRESEQCQEVLYLYPDKLYPCTVENRFHEILRKITECIIMSHVPSLERNMSFLENVNSAIEEAEHHLFCRRLVVHNKIMANFLDNLVGKVEPFLANQIFGKGRCVTILQMHQLHTSALLDFPVAGKDQTEGHNGLQEIHLHLMLPSFLSESSTSLKGGGVIHSLFDTATFCAKNDNFLHKVGNIKCNLALTGYPPCFNDSSLSNMKEKINHLTFQSSATRISENFKKCENVLFAKLNIPSLVHLLILDFVRIFTT